MAKPSLQEKFQVAPKRTETEDPGGWKIANGTRRPQDFSNYAPKRADDVDGRRFNRMPVDMDIPLHGSSQNAMPFSMGGSGDVSGDYTQDAVKHGYKKVSMKGTDDQYTGEHMDLFYGDAGGFVERNNYLDRL